VGSRRGPAFGRLASGESVEVDGETIAPADVSRADKPIPDRLPTDSAAEPLPNPLVTALFERGRRIESALESALASDR